MFPKNLEHPNVHVLLSMYFRENLRNLLVLLDSFGRFSLEITGDLGETDGALLVLTWIWIRRMEADFDFQLWLRVRCFVKVTMS